MMSHERQARIVQEYFADRDGWKAIPAPEGEEGADLIVIHPEGSFVCEVKTISSAHATYPRTPGNQLDLQERMKERRQRQEEIVQRAEEIHPRRLLLIPTEHEALFGDDMTYMTKLKSLKRHTESQFAIFKQELRKCLGRSKAASLPYLVQIHCDGLYCLEGSAQQAFCGWLESQLLILASGRVPHGWHSEGTVACGNPWGYTALYEVPDSETHPDRAIVYSILVVRSIEESGLQVDIHGYGQLNAQTISQGISDAVKQVRVTANRITSPGIARMIVLSLEMRFDDWPVMKTVATQCLAKYPDLGAIAVLDSTTTEPPPPNLPVWDWLAWAQSATWVPAMVVYRNVRVKNADPLPDVIFRGRQAREILVEPPLEEE